MQERQVGVQLRGAGNTPVPGRFDSVDGRPQNSRSTAILRLPRIMERTDDKRCRNDGPISARHEATPTPAFGRVRQPHASRVLAAGARVVIRMPSGSRRVNGPRTEVTNTCGRGGTRRYNSEYPVERTMKSHAPFDRCDRERDYKNAWLASEQRLQKDRR